MRVVKHVAGRAAWSVRSVLAGDPSMRVGASPFERLRQLHGSDRGRESIDTHGELFTVRVGQRPSKPHELQRCVAGRNDSPQDFHSSARRPRNVVVRPTDKRNAGARGSRRRSPIARKTCDGSSEPLAQAEPALASKPVKIEPCYQHACPSNAWQQRALSVPGKPLLQAVIHRRRSHRARPTRRRSKAPHVRLPSHRTCREQRGVLAAKEIGASRGPRARKPWLAATIAATLSVPGRRPPSCSPPASSGSSATPARR